MSSKLEVRADEVRKHREKGDCWLIINDFVYDFSRFAEVHPGGDEIIYEFAGKDATDVFKVVHTLTMLEGNLKPEENIGPLHVDDRKKATTQGETQIASVKYEIPPLESFLNAFDFEAVAVRHCLTPGALAYISTGASDEMSLRENHLAFHRIWLRPRVCIDVSFCDTSSSILGYPCKIPLMIAPAALAKLACEDGEVAYAKACHSTGAIQCIPTLSSCTHEEIFNARAPGQTQFFQLYVNPDRKKTRQMVENAEKMGAKALFVTVDAPFLGIREKDLRVKQATLSASVQSDKDKKSKENKKRGTSKYLSTFIDPSVTWKDIDEFRTWTSLPLVIKGIQTAEDALLAYEHGASAIVVSNHGGRQLDFARSGIEVLPEVVNALKENGIYGKMEVYVDGGIRRGVDIFKALCLGAHAVMVGRPIIYAAACHAQEGVEHMINLFQEDLSHSMKLCGARRVNEISQRMVEYRNLSNHTVPAPRSHLAEQVYIPLSKL